MIAISITTRNRPNAFITSIKHWKKFIPENAQVFIVDDNSEPFYTESDHYFTQRAGIPKAKNKSLELAYNSGAEHIFLADDDVYPIVQGWELPYINSGVNHLCFTFTESYNGVPQRRPPKRVGKLNSHKLPNGCLLYFSRKCVETAGGFDERFGLGKYEHLDLTRRIYNLGLIPYPNIDIVGSEKLFHSMDKSDEVSRSFDSETSKRLIRENNKLFNEKAKCTKFVNFQRNS